jgi:hypothetical protein
MVDTMETETSFLAESGHTYTFRVTARDRVGNAGQDEASVQTLSVVKYYGFAGQRVAMRRCGGGLAGMWCTSTATIPSFLGTGWAA